MSIAIVHPRPSDTPAGGGQRQARRLRRPIVHYSLKIRVVLRCEQPVEKNRVFFPPYALVFCAFGNFCTFVSLLIIYIIGSVP